jgi:hypothetical protein
MAAARNKDVPSRTDPSGSAMRNIAELLDERQCGNGWFVHLKPGWAINDANTPSAQHDFGEDTRAAAYRTADSAKPCDCETCRQAKATGETP